MVNTKAVELSNKLTTLTDSINELNTNLTAKIDKLTLTTNTLSDRIEAVHTDVTNEVKQLGDTLTTEIERLEASDKSLLEQFQNYEHGANTKMASLEKELVATKRTLAEKSEDLQVAQTQIARQTRKIDSLETACNRGLQHGRSFNVEIDGIPVNVGDDPEQLEVAALKIFHAINADVSEHDIDTIHRLPSKYSPKPTIIRFVSRKTVREIHDNKSKLRDLRFLDIDIPGLTDQSPLYIRASQCSFYKNLAFNCRLLKRSGEISKIYTFVDGKLSILKPDSRDWIKVDNQSTLTSNFPNFQGFKFNYDQREDVDDDDE